MLCWGFGRAIGDQRNCLCQKVALLGRMVWVPTKLYPSFLWDLVEFLVLPLMFYFNYEVAMIKMAGSSLVLVPFIIWYLLLCGWHQESSYEELNVALNYFQIIHLLFTSLFGVEGQKVRSFWNLEFLFNTHTKSKKVRKNKNLRGS